MKQINVQEECARPMTLKEAVSLAIDALKIKEADLVVYASRYDVDGDRSFPGVKSKTVKYDRTVKAMQFLEELVRSKEARQEQLI